MWIAAFSYLMVWWATVTGDAFSIPPEVCANKFLSNIDGSREYPKLEFLGFSKALQSP